MPKDTKESRIHDIALTDGLASILIIIPLFLWIGFVMLSLGLWDTSAAFDVEEAITWGRSLVPGVYEAALWSTLIAIPLVCYRVFRIYSLFKNGVELKGIIIENPKKSLRLGATYFSYTYEGKEYTNK